MWGHDDSAAWFTITGSAPQSAVAAICRGALAAQRHRVENLSIDVLSDEPWPAEVIWAVDELLERLADRQRRPRPWWLQWLPRGGGPTINLDLETDFDFDLAMAIAPYTIGGTGISDRGKIIWSGNDTGTGAAFQLEPEELEAVQRFVVSQGENADHVVPLL